MSQKGYRVWCQTDESEWPVMGLIALEQCLEMHMYALTQTDRETVEALTSACRAYGALVTLWWMTGWDSLPEEKE